MQKLIFILSLLLINVQNFETEEIQNGISIDENLSLKVKVIGIKDGDTVEVLYYQLPFTIRLEHIDAPEKKQAFGTVSKKKLSDLCFGKMVTIVSKNKKGNYDRNGRMIAEIFLENGTNINKEMVKAGLAWHFKKYSKDRSYSDVEILAKKSKLGLWQDQNAIAPWEFRQNKKPK